MKHAPLRGLRCFPRDRSGTRSGKSDEALRTRNLRETSVGRANSLHPFGRPANLGVSEGVDASLGQGGRPSNG